MAWIYIMTAADQGHTLNTKIPVKVRVPQSRFCYSICCCVDTDHSLAQHTTDGTYEIDLTTTNQQPQATSYHAGTPLHSKTHDKINQPMPAFVHGGDGHHRSDESLDHPNNRPRAQHTRSQRSSRSHYGITPDDSYRHGPSAESGRSTP
jgi:aquaporin related protein